MHGYKCLAKASGCITIATTLFCMLFWGKEENGGVEGEKRKHSFFSVENDTLFKCQIKKKKKKLFKGEPLWNSYAWFDLASQGQHKVKTIWLFISFHIWSNAGNECHHESLNFEWCCELNSTGYSSHSKVNNVVAI